ncbi:sodium-independent sulfate anion transporter-like [Ctenocephalides felis]|uniref:sodium-independent sulfate anion transporter-like n=1 Tax=Ctenocephalides felis TaxID=7515 RepID=UPI000E6E1CA4|nr:sodium-independent sulfate anion transporter-like [Ctenocephalides felis]
MTRNLLKFIPLNNWLRGYSKPKAISDFIAGVTVGLTVLPQSLAYATLAGLEPQYGLYSAFMGCFVYALLGGCRQVTIGPTALLSLMTAKYTAQAAGIELAVLLCFLSGCVQSLMAIFRMGSLVDIISLPISIGFTSATAVIIATSQIKSLLGLKYPRGSGDNFGKTLVNIYQNLPNTQLGDSLLGLSSILLLLLLRKFKDYRSTSTRSKVYKQFRTLLWLIATARNAIIVLLGVVIAYSFEKYTSTIPFQVTGSVKSGLPSIHLPAFYVNKEYCNITTYKNVDDGNNTDISHQLVFETCTEIKNKTVVSYNESIIYESNLIELGFKDMVDILGSSIILVPIIAVLGNVAISKAFGGAKLNPSRELLALSLSNIFGSFVSSMPVTGSFSRSAVNHASGVQTPLGGVYTGLLVLLAIGLLTPYFHYIPKSSLSAVIICAVIFMIEYEVVRPLWRCSRRELFGCVKTFVLSLVFSVEIGLLVGVSWDLLYVVYKAARPDLPITKVTTDSGIEFLILKPGHGLLYFPAVDFLRDAIRKAANEKGVPVIIDCNNLQDIDFTAARGIVTLSKELNGRLILMNASEKVLKVIEDANSAKVPIKNVLNETELNIILEDNHTFSNATELRDVRKPLLKLQK